MGCTVELAASRCEDLWIRSVLLRKRFGDPEMNWHVHNGIIDGRIHSNVVFPLKDMSASWENKRPLLGCDIGVGI